MKISNLKVITERKEEITVDLSLSEIISTAMKENKEKLETAKVVDIKGVSTTGKELCILDNDEGDFIRIRFRKITKIFG